jgi:hypothetical protein
MMVLCLLALAHGKGFYSFCTGRPLNPWERCSLKAVWITGITLVVYKVLDVPPGVQIGHAALIIQKQHF